LCPVGLRSVEAGIALAKWFAAETRRIYAMLSETEAEAGDRHLIEWIQSRGGRTTIKQLQRSNQRRYPSADDARAALGRLVDSGMGFWEPHPVGTTGGRPTKDFVLTACDETDETPETASQEDHGTGQ